MDNKKYVLTDETKVVNGNILHRIKYVKSFGNVKEGDLGGWIESEQNLSQEGDCCVLGDAMVYADAKVFANSIVHGDASVCDVAKVYGNADVYGNTWVYGDASVCDVAKVYGNAEVYGDASVFGVAKVYGNAEVYGDAIILGVSEVFGNAKVYGNAHVSGDAQVYGDARVCGNAIIYGDANITKTSDYLSVDNIGSRNGTTTFFKTKDNNIGVVCGCFKGTIDEFREKVKETHGDNKYAKEYLLLSDLAELRLSNKEDKDNG